jgi:hypothetical protein
MTAEQQRILIAEACGWTNVGKVLGTPPGWTNGAVLGLPDFLNDLNACAEFEKTLSDREWEKYVALLSQGITRTWWEGAREICRAKAEQRCLAYLKTKGIIQ